MAQQYKVVITPFAEKGLEDIVVFLEENVSYDTADKVRMTLQDAIANLAEMPHRHSIVQEISDENVIYRRVLKWSYRIIYTIREEELLVLVVDIANERRNPQRIKDLFS